MSDRHEKFTLVRLLREDLDRLLEFRDRLVRLARSSPGRVPEWLRGGSFGLGLAIRELLRREEMHRARSKAHRQRTLKMPPDSVRLHEPNAEG